MVGNIRMIAVGAGALSAVSVATFVGLSGRDREADKAAPGGAPVSICLKSDVRFFVGAEARCYRRDELTELRDAPVIDQRAERVSVVMTDPSDRSAPPAQCSTCRQYDEARFEGRYAMTGRDMRRETYFTRACGVLDLLLKAEPAEISHFAGGSPTAADIAALDGSSLLRFGPDPAPGALEIEKLNATEWGFSFDDQRAVMQEIANADFDGDRIEEILVFLYARPENGTAFVSAVALLEKDSADGPVVLTPQPADTARFGPSDAR